MLPCLSSAFSGDMIGAYVEVTLSLGVCVCVCAWLGGRGDVVESLSN